MKPYATLQNWKRTGRELSCVKWRWRYDVSSEQEVTVLLKWSRFCLAIQLFQLCKSQKVFLLKHIPWGFSVMTKGKDGHVSCDVRNLMRTSVFLPDLSYYQIRSETGYLEEWGEGWGYGEIMETFFSNIKLFSVPIMNEDWNWLFFYWSEKGIVVV